MIFSESFWDIDYLEEVKFDKMGCFTYSPEEDTPAFDFENQIDDDIKKRRAAEMTEVGARIRAKFLQSLVGKEFPVLFEREKADNIHHGYTPNYTHIKILTKYSEKSLRKMIFYVKIDKIEDGCCLGHILPDRDVRT